jgi:hypothetical protein
VAVLAAATLAGCPNPPDLHTEVLESPNSIDGQQLYFIPDDVAPKRAGDAEYKRIVSATDLAALPNNPAGDDVIDFNGAASVAVALGEPIFFFGESYNTIHVGANGAVGVGSPSVGNATLAEHFGSRQVSLLPVDASAAGATVTVGETDDFVVVTYAGITIGETNDNAFQVEFFKTRGIDGDLALSYPQVAASATGIRGLANFQLEGLTPEEIDDFVGGFRSSNLSADSESNTGTVELAS